MDENPKPVENGQKASPEPQKSESGEEKNNKNGALQNPTYRIIGIIVLVVFTIIGIYYYIYSLSHESTDDAFIDGHVVQISPQVSGHILKVYIQDNQPVKEGDLLAEIDPRDYLVALAQASAAWQAVEAQTAGAKSNFEITNITANAQASEASAGVQSAQATMKSMQAQLNAARKKLEESKAQVTTSMAEAEEAQADAVAAEAQYAQAELDAKRSERLYKEGAISLQDEQHSMTGAQSMQAQRDSALKKAASKEAQVAHDEAAQQESMENVKQLESQLQESQSQLTRAEGFFKENDVATQKTAVSKSTLLASVGGMQYLKAGVEKAELNLSYTKLSAPINGRVTRKAVEVGDYVQDGQVLMAIVPNEVWVTANFKETQLTKMRPGQSVNIRVDAYPGKIFKGHIDSIQSGTGSRFSLLPPENATGNYVKVVQRVPVKIVFDEPPNSKYILAPGMSVVPEVDLK